MHTQMLGTLTYIAPEIVSNEGYDRRADLYSVGVITFLLLRGRLPFEGRSPKEIIEKIRNERLDFQDRVWSKLSKEVRDFVSSLLSRDPSKRPEARDALVHPWMKLMELGTSSSKSIQKEVVVECPTSPIRVSKYPKRVVPTKKTFSLPQSPIEASKLKNLRLRRKPLSFS
jgi:serine/threonine protein kinase